MTWIEKTETLNNLKKYVNVVTIDAADSDRFERHFTGKGVVNK